MTLSCHQSGTNESALIVPSHLLRSFLTISLTLSPDQQHACASHVTPTSQTDDKIES